MSPILRRSRISAKVTANTHLGQVAKYSFDYKGATKPKNVTVTVQGFQGTGLARDSVAVYNVVFDPEGKARQDVLRTEGLGKVQSGNVLLSPTANRFITNGAVTYDVSGVQ